MVGLFLLLSGRTPQVAQADPGELFVSPDGTGTACTQATPCALQTALDIAETNGEDDVIYKVIQESLALLLTSGRMSTGTSDVSICPW